MIKPIIFYLLANIYCYLCFAFANAQLNPFVWENGLRGLCLISSVCVFMFAFGFYNDLKKNNKI